MSDFATKITKKNKGNIVKNVLCNSANLGLVPQVNYFDREIANTENTDGYYVICNGDFVYNPRKSTAAPFGPVNIYEGEEAGIISPLYLCFSVHNIFPKFLYYRFKSSAWHSYVYSHGDSGVRFDRVSIKDDVFFDMPVYKPAQDEQIKIATILQLIDERIATQNKIIEKYESLIQAICDTLISKEEQQVMLSFSDFGQSYSGLSGKSAEDFGEGYPFITYMNVYQNQIIDSTDVGLVKINETEQQSVVRNGDILLTLSSETPEEVGMGAVYLGETYPLYLNSFCFGIHITDEAKIYPPFLAYYVSSQSFRKAVYPLAQGSTRFNLQKSDFMKKKFSFPVIEKQRKIYSILKAYSDKLIIEKLIMRLLCKQKCYLLRQLFI
ncbi:restriction endonuclease subunit S [uncultured Alistipes sp.]|uniref:restriction endonuclease subunit S n=1 Tax=uncultured Alistipes sp. TaxID=538949 RepID=UPI00345B33E1